MPKDNLDLMPEIKPEIVFIFELIQEVKAGKIRIPNFQRKFVWRRSQMTDLLDSIRQQYPIGSLLIWETDTQLSSKEWVGPVHIPHAQKDVAGHVLDGQQRLSTLVGTLRQAQVNNPAPEDETDPERWLIWYNAKSGDFEHAKKNQKPQVWHLPLWCLMDTVAFLKECQRMMDNDGDDPTKYVRKSQDLARIFQTYKMPVIRIKNTSLNKAVEIFARLNTKGQAITADQMVSALTYAENSSGVETFNLSNVIDDMIAQASSLHFGGIDRAVVLRACLVTLEEEMYRTDWIRMAAKKKSTLKNSFPSIVKTTSAALTKSLEFLSNMGIKTDRLLPYSMQLVILTAFFIKCSIPSPKQSKFLRRWVWVTSFAGLLATNPSRLEALAKEFRDEIALSNNPTSLKNMKMTEPARPFPKTFDMRSARVRALLNILLSLKPMDARAHVIPDPWKMVLEHGPEALGKIFTTVEDKDLASSPANRIFRVNILDRSQAKIWLQNLSNMASDKRDQILTSHGIPPAAFTDLINDRAKEFLSKRRDHLIQLERDFMQRENVTLPQSSDPQNSPIDAE